MLPFIVDTNFFIQAHRMNYPLDVAINFWEKTKKLFHERKVISIDMVKNEIFKNDDELKRWIEVNLLDEFFKSTKTDIVDKEYKKVIAWAISKSNHYTKKAIDEFCEYENADAWLIAYALSINKNCNIVTQEKPEPNRKSQIKIPDVCIHFSIPFKNTIEMFRELGETF